MRNVHVSLPACNLNAPTARIQSDLSCGVSCATLASTFATTLCNVRRLQNSVRGDHSLVGTPALVRGGAAAARPPEARALIAVAARLLQPRVLGASLVHRLCLGTPHTWRRCLDGERVGLGWVPNKPCFTRQACNMQSNIASYKQTVYELVAATSHTNKTSSQHVSCMRRSHTTASMRMRAQRYMQSVARTLRAGARMQCLCEQSLAWLPFKVQ